MNEGEEMTGTEFLNSLAKGESDILQQLLGILTETDEELPQSVNLSGSDSDLRIQVQTDPRYQDFIANAGLKEILGYEMKVASLENVLQGKLWVFMDETRRRSKRQKDLADISRIIETYPALTAQLPKKGKDLLQDKEKGQPAAETHDRRDAPAASLRE